MKLRLCKEVVVNELRDSVPDNLELYRAGGFSFLQSDASSFLDVDLEYDEERLKRLDGPRGGAVNSPEHEARSAEVVFTALNSLTPFLARDERLWVYLCHTLCLDFARRRWPIPDKKEDAIKHIRTHFFAKTARQIERDNAISRLWWMSFICSKVEGVQLPDCLQVLLYKSDVRANLVERPSTVQNRALLTCLIGRLAESKASSEELFERETFRKLMVRLNLEGGVRLLESMNAVQLGSLLDVCVEVARDALN